MRVQILGPVKAWHGDDLIDLGPAGQRAVLGLLALAGGQPMSRAELVGALWGDQPPPSATNMIQSRMKQLRKALEPDRQSYTRSGVLPMVGDGYAFELSNVDLDLSRFRRLVADANRARRRGNPREVSALLAEALRLWHGSPLADIPSLASHPKVTMLADQRHTALAMCGEALLLVGAVTEALEPLEEAALGQPLDEGAWAGLIRAYQAAGRRAQAFAAYQDIRRRLADELGVHPGPELSAAHSALVRDDAPAVARPARVATGQADSATSQVTRRPTPAQLPTDVPVFVGRAPQQQRLDELLIGPPDAGAAGTTIAVISGPAGVGKTALAVRWAHSVRDRFPDGQLYVNLRGFDPVGAALPPVGVLRSFLDAFGVPAPQAPDSPDTLAGLYRSVLADKRVLLVLENARNADQVRPLLPGVPGCRVVVTSRDRLTSLIAFEGAQPVTLDPLPAGASQQLLARRLGAERITAEADAVQEIIKMCAGLPLALAIVAARTATDPGLALADVAGQLRHARSTLDALAGGDVSTDARAVFSLSYQALDDRTASLFRLLGLALGAEVTAAAAASLCGVSEPTARSQLGQLVRTHLLAESTGGRYRMHDLLRAYAAELAYGVDPEPLRQGVAERMKGYYLRSARAAAVLLDPSQDPPALPGPVPGVTPEHLGGPEAALAWFATEHSTLMAVIRECTDRGRDGQTWRLAWAMEEYLNRRGHSADWITTQLAALAAGERLADLAVQARAHRGLARAYTRLGRHEQAHVHFARALVLFTALDDAAGQAQVLLGTSFTWAGQGEHATAIRPAERALALFTTLGDRRGQAATLNMLGGYLREMGDHERALSYCRRALALNQEVREPRGEADAWDSLGYLYHRRTEYAEAATCYQRALERYRQLGARQYEADTLAKLGETQRVAGDRDAARASWREALALLDELGHTQFVDCDIDEIRAGLQLLDVSEDGRWLAVT